MLINKLNNKPTSKIGIYISLYKNCENVYFGEISKEAIIQMEKSVTDER